MATNEQILAAIYRVIDSGKLEIKPYDDAFSCIRNMCDETGKKDVTMTAKLKGKLRKATLMAKEQGVDSFFVPSFELNKRILCWEATESFDSYMLYVEINRPREKQFYLPRRKQLKILTDAMQDLADHKIELLAISLPPGVGKTTLALFFLTWIAGKHPDKPILTGSHANSFLTGAYSECLRMLDPQGEYLWRDVFPGLQVISTNAKDMMIDIGRDKKDGKRFTTLEFTSIGSGNAGKVRAESILYADDLIPSLEVALNETQLEKLWGQYTTDLRQRKIGDCVELSIATRWSRRDVIGRLQNYYGDSDKARFISIPALNEDDESNFDYPIDAGFSTEFYHQQREIMDNASWEALYMNQPVERSGLLYPQEELRRYFELPDREPDAILSVTDTKDKGTDYCVMPIAYQYGQDYYIEDVVCDNSSPDIVETKLVMKLMEHKVHMSRFESNSAGGRVAEKVQNEVRNRNGRTKITTKYTTQNKETKILMASPFVKQHFLFKDDSVIKDDKEYRKFLNMVCSYTMSGKNKWDDPVDAISMLADYAQSFTSAQVQVFNRPF